MCRNPTNIYETKTSYLVVVKTLKEMYVIDNLFPSSKQTIFNLDLGMISVNRREKTKLEITAEQDYINSILDKIKSKGIELKEI